MSCRCLGAQLGAALPTCPSLGLCSALCSCAPWPFPWGFQHSPGSCPAAALGLGAGIWRPLWLLGVNAAADGVLQGCCCAPPFMVLRQGLGRAREDIAVGWQCPKTTCFCLLCWPSPGCRVSYLLTCSPSAFCSLAPSQPAPQCRCVVVAELCPRRQQDEPSARSGLNGQQLAGETLKKVCPALLGLGPAEHQAQSSQVRRSREQVLGWSLGQAAGGDCCRRGCSEPFPAVGARSVLCPVHLGQVLLLITIVHRAVWLQLTHPVPA